MVTDSVSVHPEGVVIFTPTIDPLNIFREVLAVLKTLPETAAASTGAPDM